MLVVPLASFEIDLIAVWSYQVNPAPEITKVFDP
jgi:hypothetical protein